MKFKSSIVQQGAAKRVTVADYDKYPVLGMRTTEDPRRMAGVGMS